MKDKILLSLKLLLVILLVVVGSIISVRLWSGKGEKLAKPAELIIKSNMTIAEIGKANDIENIVLKNAFGLQTKEDMKKKFSEFSLTQEEARSRINKFMALQAEDASKNWMKIVIKFGLWLAFLIFMFVMMRKKKIKNCKQEMVLFHRSDNIRCDPQRRSFAHGYD